jgi:hypothetical protein
MMSNDKTANWNPYNMLYREVPNQLYISGSGAGLANGKIWVIDAENLVVEKVFLLGISQY